MVNQLEFEMKQSVMLRAVSLDIKRDYEDIIYKLYDPKYKGEGDFNASGSEWAMIISDFFKPDEIEEYTMMINLAIQNKMNLWEDKGWILQMKMLLPMQFRRRMAEFTQVPRLSTMGTPPQRKKQIERDDW